MSDVEVNLSRMAGIGLGQSRAAQSSQAGRWGQHCLRISSGAEWRLLIANAVICIMAWPETWP